MKKFLLLAISCFTLLHLSSQEIKPMKGYDNNIGIVLSMMDDLKSRVERSVSNLSQEQTDFLLDDKANRIGALILHLAATELYYQHFTFEGTGFQKGEEIYDTALNLGDKARDEFQGKPISYYLELWDKIRADSKKLLKEKDDKWFAQKVGKTNMNNHWAWYHVMEHQANHMGQIRLIMGRME